MIDIIRNTLAPKIDTWQKDTKKYAKRHCASKDTCWAPQLYSYINKSTDTAVVDNLQMMMFR